MEQKLQRAIGKVIVIKKNIKIKQVGSGSLVVSNNQKIVVTAAHMIYDWHLKKYSKEVFFTPYKKNAMKIRPIKAILPEAWISSGVIDYDTAFLVFESQAFAEIADQVTEMPVIFDVERGLEYELYGFGKRFNQKPQYSQGKAQDDSFHHSTLQGVASKGKRGMSGGPWYTKIDGVIYQNSVTSLLFRSAKGLLWGPYWGRMIKKAYDYAVGNSEDKSELQIHYFE